MQTTRLITAGAIGVVALSLVACGGSSSSSSKGASTVASTTKPADATPLTKPQLQKVVLQQTDVPTGWKPADSATGPTGTGNRQVNQCAGIPTSDDDQAADAVADFANESDEIDSEATSFTHIDSVATDKKLFSSPKLIPCFTKLIQDTFTSQTDSSGPKVTVKIVSVKFKPGSGGPAGYIGVVQGVENLTNQGTTIVAHTDFYFAAKGQTEISLGTDKLNVSYPEAAATAIVSKMLNRVPR